MFSNLKTGFVVFFENGFWKMVCVQIVLKNGLRTKWKLKNAPHIQRGYNPPPSSHARAPLPALKERVRACGKETRACHHYVFESVCLKLFFCSIFFSFRGVVSLQKSESNKTLTCSKRENPWSSFKKESVRKEKPKYFDKKKQKIF